MLLLLSGIKRNDINQAKKNNVMMIPAITMCIRLIKSSPVLIFVQVPDKCGQTNHGIVHLDGADKMS